MTAMSKTPYDPHRKQRGKNIALLVALLAFVVIVYLVSIVRMGGG
jgi:hypothetical protein